jgi:hypothetical protein
MGRAHTFAGEANTKKLLLLNDELASPTPSALLIRFIHAVPDLPALDIYFMDTITPNVTVQYGIENPYTSITALKLLLITEAGNKNKVIVNFNSPNPFLNFVLTTVIRGRVKPIAHEHEASALFLSDVAPGYLNNFQTFGVRLMNASRNRPKLSLLIQAASFGDTIRFWYPQQEVTLLDIAKDSLSGYLALRPEINGNTIDKNSTMYFFSTNYVKHPLFPDTLDHFRQTANADDRFTFVAIDTTLNSAHAIVNLDHLILRDTISPPADPTFNRIRIIHVNPDHKATLVTFAGKTSNMGFKGVSFFDVKVGPQTLELKDGNDSKTIPITVSSGRPISIYILPDTDAETFPVKIITE